MFDPRRRSPLAHRAPIRAENGAVSLAEWPFLTKIGLRCQPGRDAEAVASATGVALPTAACSSAVTGERSLLWLGPDEWLLLAPDGEGTELGKALEGALAGQPLTQTVDVSDYYTLITLTGPRGRDVLSKLITIDMHPRAFQAGRVVGTHVGTSTAVTIWLRDESEAAGPVFDILVRASLADYLWCLLADAGREFGCPEQEPKAGESMRGALPSAA
ncbi:sarcosine oxidase subunit gamma [Amorphus orientalis]|uniref:Sarcosine oxidase subunit gamma n=1 Tax=Amorphus orientalis TaxID=649198 RepID=A0AAE4AU34_9HYPH|nr:sarcosine oxidase subunit gamma family protein [Amorphus orientalis]MDQ0316948.1 sarcosine oxidase subunit gamma [Amorphus orientalis]